MIRIDPAYLRDLLRAMVAINSVNPSLVPGAPAEGEIAGYVAGECRKAGFDVTVTDVAPGRPNVIATLRGRGRGKTLLLNGHLDTVALANPGQLEPVERDGRLYGRGSYDMKGGIAAMLAAASAVRQAELPLAGDLMLTMVVDEEYASLGTEAVVQYLSADAAIVTEPTHLDVCVAHKGFAWVAFETTGRAAHGSRYDEGEDAILAMGRMLAQLSRLETERYPRYQHPLLGRPSLHASFISGGDGLSTYPKSCRLEVERRTLPHETEAEITAEMQEVLRAARQGDPTLEARSEVFFFRPGYEVDSGAPIVTTLTSAATRVLGARPQHIGVWPWLDSAILGRAGIPTVIFGPAGAGAHSEEEYVEIDSVIRCAEVLATVIVEFCGVA